MPSVSDSSAAIPNPRARSSEFVLAMSAPAVKRKNPFTGSVAGMVGLGFLLVMVIACLGSLPWTLGTVDEQGVDVPRYNAGDPKAGRLPPSWVPQDAEEIGRAIDAIPTGEVRSVAESVAPGLGMTADQVLALAPEDGAPYETFREELKSHRPTFAFGTDAIGRSLGIRVLTGGGISLGIGIAAAVISVAIGTLYGAIAGYAGKKTDAFMMRIVDVLYGLPYILLVVLLAVASDALIERWELSRVASASEQQAAYVEAQTRAFVESTSTEPGEDEIRAWQTHARDEVGTGRLNQGARTTLDVVTLLIAIGGVSWLTMARVVRGQVLSLKNQPFVESARAIGVPTPRIFARHLLPNLVGPIIVYATLIVPQAILQESFLSFLGIGVKPPLPSWGNLAADGLSELNTYRSHWWLLAVPCVLLGVTLLALNFVGEGLREALDPKRTRGS